MSNPIVLIHGYSDKGESFLTWKKELEERFADRRIHVVSYRTLTNEVSIKDIAEAFDRALKLTPGLNADEDFDAIVHSTGMLVIRSWLVTYPERRARLKRLIGLAPASFGSPLATMGRSTLGSIFKGNKAWGPDFLEAGDMVLDGLELGSRFTWDLAHQDLLSEAVAGRKSFYGPDKSTPYVFIFCGNKAYSGLRKVVNDPGTDGTVRWAGCSLNTRKISLDLTHADDGKETEAERSSSRSIWLARFTVPCSCAPRQRKPATARSRDFERTFGKLNKPRIGGDAVKSKPRFRRSGIISRALLQDGHPVFRAVLIPFGGAGLVTLLEYPANFF